MTQTVDDSSAPQKHQRDTEKVLNQKISGVSKIKIREKPEKAEKKKKDREKEREKKRKKDRQKERQKEITTKR